MLMVVALIVAGGCGAPLPSVQRVPRMRSLKVTSETPGARVLLEDRDMGRTPLKVEISYIEGVERIHGRRSGKGTWHRHLPWYVGVFGGLALAGGGVTMTVLAVEYSDELGGDYEGSPTAPGIMMVAGILAAISGLTGTSWGIWRATQKDPVSERHFSEPAAATLSVMRPDGQQVHARLSLHAGGPRPRLTRVGRMHVFDQQQTTRRCRLRISTPDEAELLLLRHSGQPISLGKTPLELACLVRRRAPRIGYYSRAGHPLFRLSHDLQLTGQQFQGSGSPWWEGELSLPLILRRGDGQATWKVVLSASKAWRGPMIHAVGRPDASGPIKADLKYRRGTPASAPTSQPVAEPPKTQP